MVKEEEDGKSKKEESGEWGARRAAAGPRALASPPGSRQRGTPAAGGTPSAHGQRRC